LGIAPTDNGGPIHAEFEEALCNYLGAKHICLCSSGTTALMIALRALGLKGEVITTPFTSVATAQSIYWNKLKPVFVDIDKDDLNINVTEIEKAITPDTCAIVPVHIFGNPCKVDKIRQLAEKHNLKTVYDAAHCFGVELKGEPICNFGDLSVLSFHATKVFNTVEGGAIICHDEATKKYIDALINTGLDKNQKLAGYGFNAKMNEIQAAIGLAQLKYIDGNIASRMAATLNYRELLQNMEGIVTINEKAFVKYNYPYFPIIVDPDKFGRTRDDLYDHLQNKNIIARKYFHPLITDFPEFSGFKKGKLSTARNIADNILCLPLFHDITLEEINNVVDAVHGAQH
jgi:dTDP-4-amino-4,6-dideoxygalactose transaminase